MKWIACKDRLPDKFGHYLVYAESADPKSPLIVSTFYDPDRRDCLWGLVKYWSDGVSHWMPLPKPPAKRKKRNAKAKA